MIKNLMDNYVSQVTTALEILKIKASPNQIDLWLGHLTLLQKWNKAYNMTAITAFDEMLVKHLFDSLTIAPFITGHSIIDVGTGGGFPGIPLAILMPEKHYILIDSVAKKIRFLNHVKKALKLKNVIPIHARIQAYRPAEKFDYAVSRAFSSVQDFYKLCQHCLKKNASLLAMKGAEIEKHQLEHLPIDYQVIKLKVPLLAAKRHLIVINPNIPAQRDY